MEVEYIRPTPDGVGSKSHYRWASCGHLQSMLVDPDTECLHCRENASTREAHELAVLRDLRGE